MRALLEDSISAKYRQEDPREKVTTKQWECLKTRIKMANKKLPKKEQKAKQKSGWRWNLSKNGMTKKKCKRTQQTIAPQTTMDEGRKKLDREQVHRYWRNGGKTRHERWMRKSVKSVARTVSLNSGGYIKNRQEQLLTDNTDIKRRDWSKWKWIFWWCNE